MINICEIMCVLISSNMGVFSFKYYNLGLYQNEVIEWWWYNLYAFFQMYHAIYLTIKKINNLQQNIIYVQMH